MSASHRSRSLHPVVVAFAVAALAGAGGVSAQIAQTPLTLTNSVKPNIMLSIDDSGSMDFELLFPTDDGLFWETGSSGRGFANESGQFHESADCRYHYLFPNGMDDGDLRYSTEDIGRNCNTRHYAVPPVPEFGFARSSDYNAQYYNPAVTYGPWTNHGSRTFGNASTTGLALSDPIHAGSDGRINLFQNLSSNSSNWRFRVQVGMPLPNNQLAIASDVDQPGEGLRSYTYHPATYYKRFSRDLAFTLFGTTYDCSAPSAAAYRAWAFNGNNTGANSRNNVQSYLSGLGIDALGPDGACLERVQIAAGDAEAQNFANWFTYHRKRHLALRASLGEVLDTLTNVRVGAFTINDRDTVTMWDIDTDADKDALYDFIYGIDGASQGTPNRQALKHAGDQFDLNTNVIQYSCQKNFTLHFTDGYSDVVSLSGIGNEDAGDGAPYQDAYSDTIADVAMKYYKGVRRSTSPLPLGKVPVPPACNASPAPAQIDCNEDPHMNTYAVTLGTRGNIFGVTHLSVADAYATTPVWVNPDEKNQEQIDDLYHAAINGRGEMLNARSTSELTNVLAEALRSILGNVLGSSAATSANSTRLTAGTRIYQARYNSGDWTGELIAYTLDSITGSISGIAWNAADEMPAAGSRSIYTTIDDDGDPTSAQPANQRAIRSFFWDNLDADQQAALDRNRSGTTDSRGADRVGYLRGDASREVKNGGPFRSRRTSLGDIVNSAPWFVGAQNFAYERLPSGAPGRDTYQTFRSGNQSRTPMVYVGANDGMLHAIDAETGTEQWAFIPTELVSSLNQLTAPEYVHRYYMDGQAVAGDAYFSDNQWHTVLIAPTGAGGTSVVAIDITGDPETFNASRGPSTSGAQLLWEFSDPDLGSVIGRPSIARMANGQWAAIFGSGYGLDKSAKLFVVNLQTGALIRKISTVASEAGAASNGLSPPFPADLNGDTIVDVIYAGDLKGHLWKFDVSDSNANQWAVAHRAGSAPAPLFTACYSADAGTSAFACTGPGRQLQPITMRPVVGRGPGPTGSLMVLFGTGKFFEIGDNVVPTLPPARDVQSFYGVIDANSSNANNDRIAGRSELTQQSILAEVCADLDRDGNGDEDGNGQCDDGEYRVTSGNVAEPDSKGWYMDLISPRNGRESERVVSDPVLRGGRLIFTTLIPSSDVCAAGGSGWLMELGGFSGARFSSPVLDVDGDRNFDDEDKVDYGGSEPAPPSGVKFEDGAGELGAIIEGPGFEVKSVSLQDGSVEMVGEQLSVSKGRNSWRQLWP